MNVTDDDWLLRPIPDVSEIAPHLLMGSWPERSLVGVCDVVVNCAMRRHRPLLERCIVLNYAFIDEASLPEAEHLYAVADAINLWRAIGLTVLVHCEAGLNRSGLVVGTALVRLGMRGADAVALIRKQRHQDCLCNETFANWLMTL
jgi:protein-tyrosine phosphatase